MGKKITEFGYKATAVVCGKFFDLDNIRTLKEMAEFYGGDYDEKWQEDDKQLVEAFSRDGFEFLGCVGVKQELVDELCEAGVYVEGGYLVRGAYLGKRKRLYVVHDVWDEARGYGNCKAYRYNLFTRGDWDFSKWERVYKKVTQG